jgi:ATP-binding cassette subfamily B (MDR/TAP) protein 1
MQAAPNLQYFTKGQAAAGRMFAIIDRKPAIDASSGEGERPKELEGRIELQNVSFAYPARPDVQVFRDFSLVVPAGKTVALVGSSG